MLGGFIFLFGYTAALALGYLLGTRYQRKGRIMPVGLGLVVAAAVLGPHAFPTGGGDAGAWLAGSGLAGAAVFLLAGKWLPGKASFRLLLHGLALAVPAVLGLYLAKSLGLVDSDTLWWSNTYWVLAWAVMMPLLARVKPILGRLFASYRGCLAGDAGDPGRTATLELLSSYSYSPGYMGISMFALSMGIVVLGGWLLDSFLGGCWDGDAILFTWLLPLWAAACALVLKDILRPVPRLAIGAAGMIIWFHFTSVTATHGSMLTGLSVFGLQAVVVTVWAMATRTPWELLAGAGTGCAGNPALGLALAAVRGEYEALPVLAVLSPLYALAFWWLGA